MLEEGAVPDRGFGAERAARTKAPASALTQLNTIAGAIRRSFTTVTEAQALAARAPKEVLKERKG